MSLVPEFELGLWNAWILVLLMFVIIIGLSSLVIRLFFGSEKNKESSRRHSATPEYTRFEKSLSHLSTVMLIVMTIYSVFLTLKLGTFWFYVGLFIYVLGMIFGFTAMINFALAPLDKPATKGAYSISRNPMYLSMFLMFVGISVASASWFFLLLTIISIILSDRLVIAEERLCLKTYGDSYREYIDRIPRWIGVATVARALGLSLSFVELPRRGKNLRLRTLLRAPTVLRLFIAFLSNDSIYDPRRIF